MTGTAGVRVAIAVGTRVSRVTPTRINVIVSDLASKCVRGIADDYSAAGTRAVGSKAVDIGGKSGRRTRAYNERSPMRRNKVPWRMLLDGREIENRKTRCSNYCIVIVAVTIVIVRTARRNNECRHGIVLNYSHTGPVLSLTLKRSSQYSYCTNHSW